MITRRAAIHLIGASAAGVLMPSGVQRTFAATSSGMLMRAVPKTGEKLPVMGLG